MKEHLLTCKEKLSKLEEGKDYVNCKICNINGQKLGTHIVRVHKISIEEYCKQYSSLVTSKVAKRNYSLASIGEKGSQRHKSFISKFNGDKEAINAHFKKVGRSISKAIMSDELELSRRSNVMSKIIHELVKDESYIKSLSKRAVITSNRPDIIEKRSQQLKKWRDDNKEEFHTKCTKKMLSTRQSKPEKKLFEFLKSLDGFDFKKNQFLKDDIFSTKSKKKQIDIFDKKKNIIVEYDGVFHFDEIFSKEQLEYIQKKDKQLEDYALSKGWTLIRVGHDQYIDRNKIEKSFFIKDCLDEIVSIITNDSPGIYKIGKCYN